MYNASGELIKQIGTSGFFDVSAILKEPFTPIQELKYIHLQHRNIPLQ